MQSLLCCLCGDKPRVDEVDEDKPRVTSSASSEPSSEKDQAPAAPQSSATVTAASIGAQQLALDEEVALQHASGRLARHLLERQPSKSNRAKLQSSSFGGTVGQRWVHNQDPQTHEHLVNSGNNASAGLLFQVRCAMALEARR